MVWALIALLGVIHALPSLIAWVSGLPEDVVDFWFVARLSHLRVRVWEGEYWRLGTATLLHGNLLHLVFNAALLYYAGRTVERAVGPARFLLAYSLAALGGAVTYQAFSGVGAGLGASGAILGVVGVFVVGHLCRFGREEPRLGRRFWAVLLVVLALLVVDALISPFLLLGFEMFRNGFRLPPGHTPADVALTAHVGGFLTGVVFGYLSFLPRSPARTGARIVARAILVGGIAATAVYGIWYPLGDWMWRLRDEEVLDGDLDASERQRLYEWARRRGGDAAAERILALEVEAGRVDVAFECWRRSPLDDPDLHRAVGYSIIYDALAAGDRPDDARRVLTELRGLVDGRLEGGSRPDWLNEAAWYRALLREDLDTALRYAEEAYEATGNASVLNTRGWVRFRKGDWAPALADLAAAARVEPSGPHLVYLALFYWETGRRALAANHAQQALAAGGLQKHERRLVDEIRATLDSG